MAVIFLAVVGCRTHDAPSPRPQLPAAPPSYRFADGTGQLVIGVYVPTETPVRVQSQLPDEIWQRLVEGIDATEQEEEEVVEVDWEDPGPVVARAKQIEAYAEEWSRELGIRIVVVECLGSEFRRLPLVVAVEDDFENARRADPRVVHAETLSLDAVRDAFQHAPQVVALDADPRRVLTASHQHDVLRVSFPSTPNSIRLIDRRGDVHWTAKGTGETTSIPFDAAQSVHDFVVQATWTRAGVPLERGWRIVDLVGTVTRDVYAGDTVDAGGVFAVRTIVSHSKTKAPFAGRTEQFQITRRKAILAQAEGTSDASGTMDVRLAVPQSTTPGPALLRVGPDRFKIEIRRSLRVSIVMDRGIYRPHEKAHVRVLVHRFPSGRPAAKEPVTLRYQTGSRTRETTVTTSEFGIASFEFRVGKASRGRRAVRATAGDGRAFARFRIQPFERPLFSLTLDPNRARPGEQVTAYARYFDGTPMIGAQIDVRAPGGPAGKTDATGAFRFTVPVNATGFNVRLKSADGRTVLEYLPVATRPAPTLQLAQSFVAGLPCLLKIHAPGHRRVRLAIGGRPVEVALDESGHGSWTLPPTDARVQIAMDAGGVQSTHSFEPTRALFRADRRTALVGTSLRLESATPVSATQPLYIDVRRGRNLLRTLVRRASDPFELEIEPDWVGVVTLEAYRFASRIERSTTVNVLVLRNDGLRVLAEPDRPAYRPRETARVDVSVRDAQGKPTSAALGYWAVDEAVLSLSPPTPGFETVFRSLPARPNSNIHAVATDTRAGRPASHRSLDRALGAIRHGATHFPLVYLEHEARAREHETLMAKLSWASVKGVGRGIEKMFLEIPLAEIRAFGSLRQLVGWYVANGYLPAESTRDPWGGSWRFVEAKDHAGLMWRSAGPDRVWRTADDRHVTWRQYDLTSFVPDRVFRLVAALHEHDKDFHALPPFIVPLPNSAIGIGGGAGGGRRGRGGKRHLRAGGGAAMAAAPIRSDFRPTLVFVPERILGPTGKTTLEIPLADSITTWQLRLVATARSGAIGVAETQLRVRQPLQAEPWVAPHLTVGDRISMPVLLRNDTDRPMTARVQLKVSSGLHAKKLHHSVSIPARGAQACRFPIEAREAGAAHVEIDATAGTERDRIRKSLTVHRAEFRRVDSAPLQFRSGRVPFARAFPDRVSGEFAVELVPNATADAVGSYRRLIREPHGCFEQTASTVYPMAMALALLKRDGQTNEALEKLARAHLEKRCRVVADSRSARHARWVLALGSRPGAPRPVGVRLAVVSRRRGGPPRRSRHREAHPGVLVEHTRRARSLGLPRAHGVRHLGAGAGGR